MHHDEKRQYNAVKSICLFLNFWSTVDVVVMRNHEKYKSMVSAFRMSELQALMVFAGKSKAGKKSDLQVE